MFKQYKILIISIILAVIALVIGLLFFISTTKNKELLIAVDRVYAAYNSYLMDMGHSAENIRDLLSNVNGSDDWKGPYITDSFLNTGNAIDIVSASRIPTKKCSLDYFNNCYKWIKVEDISSGKFDKIKQQTTIANNIFFANNAVYFKLNAVE